MEIVVVNCSNIAKMKKQLVDLGCSFDWHRVSQLSALVCTVHQICTAFVCDISVLHCLNSTMFVFTSLKVFLIF